MTEDLICSICDGHDFNDTKVLWPELIAEWQLTRSEVDYIDLSRVAIAWPAARICVGLLSDMQSAAQWELI
jgi:hypothetical protein